jgi:hypothetical protein
MMYYLKCSLHTKDILCIPRMSSCIVDATKDYIFLSLTALHTFSVGRSYTALHTFSVARSYTALHTCSVAVQIC